MIWASYLAFFLLTAWALSRGGWAGRGRHLALRAGVLVLSVGFSAIAAGAAIDLADDPHNSWDEAWGAWVAFGSVALGGLTFAAGTALWHGTIARLLRFTGWALIAIPLLFPTTATLLLPLAALLTFGLRGPTRTGSAYPASSVSRSPHSASLE